MLIVRNEQMPIIVATRIIVGVCVSLMILRSCFFTPLKDDFLDELDAMSLCFDATACMALFFNISFFFVET